MNTSRIKCRRDTTDFFFNYTNYEAEMSLNIGQVYHEVKHKLVMI